MLVATGIRLTATLPFWMAGRIGAASETGAAKAQTASAAPKNVFPRFISTLPQNWTDDALRRRRRSDAAIPRTRTPSPTPAGSGTEAPTAVMLSTPSWAVTFGDDERMVTKFGLWTRSSWEI